MGSDGVQEDVQQEEEVDVETSPGRSTSRRRKVQSIEVGMGVLRAVAASGRSGSLSAIATAAAIHSAKAHRYLQSLAAAGFVQQDRSTSAYRLGPEALRIGLAALDALDVVQLAAPHLGRLSAELGESCFLAVPTNAGATVVRIEQPPRSITIAVRLGSVLPDLTSATGLCFAAFVREARVAPGLEHALATIRRWGSASVRGSALPGVDAVSAPVFDHTGRLCGALTTLAAAGTLAVDPEGAASALVRSEAGALSRDLGFTPLGGGSA